MTRIVGCVGAALIAWGVAGCGGDTSGGGAGCGEGDPCGGDVVGKWKIEQTCVQNTSTNMFAAPECDGSINSGSTTTTGSYEFRADGTRTFTGVIDGTVSTDLTDACLVALGLPAGGESACTSLASEMSSQPSDGAASTFDSITCTYATGHCRCTFTANQKPMTAESTYRVDGTVLVDSAGQRQPYCVTGDTMRVFAPEDATVTGVILLSRQ